MKELYSQLREQLEEDNFPTLLECVELMKSLLEENQQHDAYRKFAETDFSHTLIHAVGSAHLLARSLFLATQSHLRLALSRQVPQLRSKLQ